MAARRVLIINNRVPYPMNDGGNIAVNAMIEAYKDAGWEVFLLAMNTSRHYITKETLSNIYNHIYAFETVDIDNDLKPLAILKNLVFSSRPNHADRFFHQAFFDKLSQVLDSFRPDVVQVESIYLTEYLPLIKEKTDALTVLRLHNIEYQVWKRLADKTANPFKRLYLQNLGSRLEKYEKKAWEQYDLLLPITDTDAEYISKCINDTERLTIPPGIDFGKMQAHKTDESWTGYHIGAMDWQPNANGIWWFLQKAWPVIHNEFPHFKFYYAGRNMPGRFKSLNYENVICEGEVVSADDFIADKKILFVPIHSAGGIRVKILEAMARGKLVISTDIGMQGINAKKKEHYLAANTAKEFAEALSWTMTHKKEAEDICHNASEMVRNNYDEKIVADRLLGKVNHMLDSKHR